MPQKVSVFVKELSWFEEIEKLLSKRYDVTRGDDNSTIIVTENSTLGFEAYTLDITATKVLIYASSKVGVQYAMSTLRQLIGLDLDNALQCQCVSIEDEPKYEYRGMMLDISRHFYDKEQIKSILDMLALHKMNKFHLHLTDDNGWRIEIKKYPLLTEIGSKRNGTQVCSWGYPIYDETPYSGYLSQNEYYRTC